jgi:hypothetical protein
VEPAGDVLRQRVEAVLALARRPSRHRLGDARAVLLGTGRGVERPLLRGPHPLPDPAPLLRQDLVEPLGDVVEHPVEVGPLQLRLPLRPQPLHDRSQSRDVAAARAPQPALHEPLQGAPHVALGQDVVGQRVEHVVRVEGGQLLAAIPSAVAEGAHAASSLGRCRGAVHASSIQVRQWDRLGRRL